ncbi:Fels-1 Prophage Protein-like [Shimwellia blattae]|nr:Fels-1 Prophage Protein-like [Shimwellia blattae]
MAIRKAGLMIALGLMCAPGLWAAAVHHPYSPHPGVLCDAYICADSTGISQALTGKYLGQGRADKLAAAGAFDTRAFTFAGGVFVMWRKNCAVTIAISVRTGSAVVGLITTILRYFSGQGSSPQPRTGRYGRYGARVQGRGAW